TQAPNCSPSQNQARSPTSKELGSVSSERNLHTSPTVAAKRRPCSKPPQRLSNLSTPSSRARATSTRCQPRSSRGDSPPLPAAALRWLEPLWHSRRPALTHP